MKSLLRLMPVSVLSAIALAACGSSGHSPTVASLGGGAGAQAGAAPGRLAAARAAVVCAREHGMPWVRDPVVGANGQVRIPGGTPVPTPAVRSACAAQIRSAEANTSTPLGVGPSDMQALVRYADCMRAHGLPRWPDPNPQGVFHVRSADAGTLVTNRRASSACESLGPPSGTREDITPSGQ